MGEKVVIFSRAIPEDEQDQLIAEFAALAESEAETLVSTTDLHPEKKRMIPATTESIASKLSRAGEVDPEVIRAEVNHQANVTRANILKPEEGDYEYCEKALFNALEKWQKIHLQPQDVRKDAGKGIAR